MVPPLRSIVSVIFETINRRIYSLECKVNLATIVEGDQKAPFSIATTSRCRGGRYSFPWIATLYS